VKSKGREVGKNGIVSQIGDGPAELRASGPLVVPKTENNLRASTRGNLRRLAPIP